MFSANTPQGSSVTVTTQTFYSSTTWVAPAGVTSIITLVGKGQDGTSDSWQDGIVNNIHVAVLSPPSTPGGMSLIGSTLDWSTPYGTQQSYLSSLNSGAPGQRNITVYIPKYYYFTDPAYQKWYYSLETSSGSTIQGYAGIAEAVPSSGIISTSSPFFNQYRINASRLVPGSAGSNTTGFGYTFAGGAANTAATPVTYNSVAVTPGASYSLSIPSGGYIQITYAS